MRWIFRIFAILAVAAPHGIGQIVYQTDFENFQVGPGMLVGTEGWLGSTNGGGWQGIDQDAIPGGGLGKTAFVGFAPPTGATNTVVVTRPVNLNPATHSEPIIEFESQLGIKDSTNDFRDDFTIAFYNISQGTRLAQIRFQNTANSTWILRGDGSPLFHNTFINFLHGELHLLYVRIDLVANRWSAYLDGIPLFNGAQFTAQTTTRTLGNVGVEWRRGVRPIGVTTWGDNWMLIADWSVRMVPFQLLSATRDAGGTHTLKWIGDPAHAYQVEHTDHPGAWQNTLPNSTFPIQSSHSIMAFTDPSPPVGRRFYRVRRD